MEKERDIDPQGIAFLSEGEERLDIINQRAHGIFRTHDIESYIVIVIVVSHYDCAINLRII
jgi:hypothetical protein